MLIMSYGAVQHEPEAAVPTDIDAHPFTYRPLPPANCCYVMIGGVVRVFADNTCTQELYPVPGTAADFFTDMHRWVWR
jgi:AMP deaminase